MIHWKDLPKLTSIGHYEVCISLDVFKESVERYTKEYNLNLLPDFQRGHVWNEGQKLLMSNSC